MSLLEMMSEGNSFKKVHVSEIRPNPLNFYAHMDDEEIEDEYVNATAEQIADVGQDMNALVYHDTDHDDGKTYTLLSGERRWKACLRNFEAGKGDGMFQVKIVNRPDDEAHEIMRIIMGNSTRNKTAITRKAEIETLEKAWQELCDAGQKPKGKKRDWIGGLIGLSSRQVQEYLTGDLSGKEKESSSDTSERENTDSKKKAELTSSDLDGLDTVKCNLESVLGRKVKINQKTCAITFYPNKDDDLLEDMYRLLDELGFTSEGVPK